ncbi:MAG: hypothetical protein JO307_32400 [Bryobacterales bacterium]|nr:hypothetical protein [Bryobacterales bacterium]
MNSVRLGLELAFALNKLYPGKLDLEKCKLSIGNRRTIELMKSGADPVVIEKSMTADRATFMSRRKPFLKY